MWPLLVRVNLTDSVVMMGFEDPNPWVVSGGIACVEVAAVIRGEQIQIEIEKRTEPNRTVQFLFGSVSFFLKTSVNSIFRFDPKIISILSGFRYNISV